MEYYSPPTIPSIFNVKHYVFFFLFFFFLRLGLGIRPFDHGVAGINTQLFYTISDVLMSHAK